MGETSLYMHPHGAALAAGPIPAAGGLRILGVEVTQAIQDIDNSVSLIAGKTTVVRVYIDHESLTSNTKLTGELEWRRSGGASYLASLNAVDIRAADPRSLDTQRSDVVFSLNFRLPSAATASGNLRLRVKRIYQPGSQDLEVAAANREAHVTFKEAPPLRIRVIGLRYRRKDGKSVKPSAVDFSYLRSYLNRAYPVPSVEWSQIVVNANFAAPVGKDTARLANMQLAAIRSREVSDGVDPRTHYLGLVSDDGGANFMRGLAYDIPETPNPDVVASSPCGVPEGLLGDGDASYADWYGTHELSHTMGRDHPGFPPPSGEDGQNANDKKFPFEEGQLTNTKGVRALQYVGFDTGDSELNLPMRTMHGAKYHDVMTYMPNQWLSSYTYEAILERLIAEDRDE